MKIYRNSFWITGAVAIFSFLIAKCLYAIPSEQFYYSIFLGVFSSAALVAISSGIAFCLEKEKCRAKAKYSLILLEHIMKDYKLKIIYAKTDLVNNTSHKLIQMAYDYVYQIDTVFIDLSLSQVGIIDKKILPLFIKSKKELENVAIKLDSGSEQENQIIEDFFTGTRACLKNKPDLYYFNKTMIAAI